MVEQTLQGVRTWNKSKMNLEWSPFTGSVPVSQIAKMTWIRAMGLPLHMWSSEVFHQIGDLCGGWKAAS